MRDYEQMERDIQELIKKVIHDKVAYEETNKEFYPSYYDMKIELDFYAWPGGYPLYYITKDCGVLCPKCVNENIELLSDPYDPQWYIVGYDINYEDSDLYCDHCGERIESAYGDCDE